VQCKLMNYLINLSTSLFRSMAQNVSRGHERTCCLASHLVLDVFFYIRRADFSKEQNMPGIFVDAEKTEKATSGLLFTYSPANLAEISEASVSQWRGASMKTATAGSPPLVEAGPRNVTMDHRSEPQRLCSATSHLRKKRPASPIMERRMW